MTPSPFPVHLICLDLSTSGGGARASCPRPSVLQAPPRQPGPAPPRLPGAAKARGADHAGRSGSGHAQWQGRWGRRGPPGPAGSGGAGAEGEVGGSRGPSVGSRRQTRDAGQVGTRVVRAAMSNGIGQGGREGPAHESQVSRRAGRRRPPEASSPGGSWSPAPLQGQPGLTCQEPVSGPLGPGCGLWGPGPLDALLFLSHCPGGALGGREFTRPRRRFLLTLPGPINLKKFASSLFKKTSREQFHEGVNP